MAEARKPYEAPRVIEAGPLAEAPQFCGWRATVFARSCYGPATHAVETTPSRRHLNFACELHRLHDQWAHQIKVAYQIIPLEQWIAEGRGYRGPSPGSTPTPRRD